MFATDADVKKLGIDKLPREPSIPSSVKTNGKGEELEAARAHPDRTRMTFGLIEPCK